MNKLINLIKELKNKNFSLFEFTWVDENTIGFKLEGFYKSGNVTLYQKDEKLYAIARYDEITELDEENPFDSLIYLNYDWWKKSKDRFEGWKEPDHKFLPYFLEKGLVKEKITKTYE